MCLKYILKIHSSNKTTSGQPTSSRAHASDCSYSGPPGSLSGLSRACPPDQGRKRGPRPRRGGRELTTGVEDPCPLGVIAGGVEDKSVVIEEGSGALGPYHHNGHVFQVCRAKQRTSGKGLAHRRCSNNVSILCSTGRERWVAHFQSPALVHECLLMHSGCWEGQLPAQGRF